MAHPVLLEGAEPRPDSVLEIVGIAFVIGLICVKGKVHCMSLGMLENISNF